MSILLRANLIAGSVIALAAIVFLVHRGHLQVKFALAWLGAGCVFVLWAAVPAASVAVARLLGIQVESNAVFLVVILFCLVVLLILSVSASRDNLRVKRLAQEIALLRQDLDSLRRAH